MTEPYLVPRRQPDGAAARRPVAWLVALTLVLGILGPIVAPLSPAAAAPTSSNRWTFDAGTGTTAVDSRGSRPLTLSSGASWSTTPIQGASALATNGTTGAATSTGAVLTTSSSFSVSAWVRLTNTSGYQTVVSQDGNSVSGFYLGLRGDNGRLSFTKPPADSTAATGTVVSATNAPVVGQWYHVVGIYDSAATTMSLYVNGRLQQTQPASAAWNATGNLAIGRAKYNGGSVDFVNGAIDDVSVYPSALSATDVEQITESAHWKFEEGSGTTAADDSANGYTATLTNGPTWTPGEIGTTAVLLDGANDSVTTTNSVVDTSKSFAVSAWARADGSTTGSTVVASVDGTSASGFSLQLGTGGRWAFTRASANVTSPTYTTALSSAAAVSGTWYHLVGVYDSVAGTLALYVNGVKQQTVSYTTGWRATGNFVVGRNRVAGSAGNYWNGAIDDVRAYSYVLDDASVLALAGTVPSAPAAPTAVPGVASAAVSWSPPASNGGSNVTGYVVTPYRNGVAQTAVSYDASTTTRTLTGLTAGASYTFTVAAVNPIGPSTASVASAAVTTFDLPGAPTISAAAAGSERVTVSWSAPASNGGTPITGYVVTPYVGGTAQTAQTFSGTATTQTVTGLTAGTSYTFRVAAVNAVGTGPQSTASAAVTPNAGPTITSGAPPVAQVGTAYSFTFTRSAGTSPFSWSVSTGSLPPGLTLSSTTGVLSGTPTTAGSYAFSVRVTDASGYTDTRAVTVTVTGRPEAPAAPTATAGLTSAVLSWTAPATNGAPITGYVITPYRDGAAQPTITVDPSAKTRTLNGLTAGASYTFTVAAVNSNGTSAASPASNAVTPYAALNAPTITAVTAGSTSATLTWTAPTSTGGSPITGYVVTPYLGSTAQTPQTFNGTATTRTLTGLTPGAAYTFTVAARNNSGTTVLYRVDSGGPGVAALDGGPAWSDDSGIDNPFRNSGSNTSDLGAPNSVDSTVPSTTPLSIFNTERWDPGNSMKWAFPVTTGRPVTVRLYFVENYLTGPGQRFFDVALDGTTVLSSLDVYTSAGGGRIGTMREFSVTSDGTVNIDFGRVQDNAIIDGIEILQTGTATDGPPSNSSAAVTPNASPSLTFPAPPAGQVNVAYSQALAVTGGTAPFTWSVSSGTLPAGLTLGTSSGVLSGTPTAAGTFEFTVRVVDASGESATRAVSLVIAPAPVVTFTPAAGEVNVPYSQQPTVTGGTGPFSWAVTAGSLPSGLSLNATSGLISGTPTAAGTFSVTLRVTDSFGATASRSVSLVIAPLPTLTSAPPKQYQQAGFSFQFAATGGTAPFTYAVVSGSLPSGLTLSSAGVLSGQTNKGSYSFTVRATDALGQTADDPVTLVVDAAPIQVVKTASATSVAPGGTVTFTVTASNISSTYYGNTHLYDPLADVTDDATYNANVVISSGAVSYDGSTLDWQIPLSPGQSETLTYTVTVATPPTGNNVLTGQVDGVFASTSCSAGQVSPACTSRVTVSGLSVTTTAGAATTTPGSTVAFSLAITNTGQTPFTGATVSQSLAGILDDATYNGNATATAGSVSYANPTLTWTGNLAVGATVTVSYSVTVNNPATGNRSLTATAMSAAAGSTCPSGNPAPACTATVTVLIPALSITNTAGVSTTTPGSTVAYTVVVTNTGQTAYPAGTAVTVALTGALDDATYVNADATTGTVAFDLGSARLTWTGALAVGASVTITYAVTVTDPDPGNKTLTTVASSSAAGSTCPVGSGNPACTSTVTVLVPALTLTVSGNTTAGTPSTTTPGSTVTSTVLVTNTGQTAYAGAAFAADLSGVLDDAAYVDASASSGTVSFSTPTLSWSGNLAVGASATITYTVTVADPDLGDRSLSTRVTSTTQGNNCPTDSADARCGSTVAVLVPGLSLGIAADVATTTPGSLVRYTLTVANTGETTYTNVPVRISSVGLADDGVLGSDGVLSTGTVQPAVTPNVAIWTLSLAPGQTATGSVSFTVNDPDLGDRSLVHTITSTAEGSSCPTAGAAAGCTSTLPVLLPGLTVTKTADRATVQPGGAVTYTVVVQNTGETAYPAASFTDALGQVLDDAVYAGGATASVGTVSFSGSTLSWTGALGVGASATVSYAVTVRDPDPGDKLMTNRVVSTAQGSNCGPASIAPACVSRVDVLVPGLRLVKNASVASTTPGAVVGYTITVTNTGDTAYTGATFSDPLAGVLDDATYNGNAAASVGTASYAGSTVSWTGNLAIGASATVTYSVTVRAADVGNDLLSNTLVSTTPGNNCPTGGTDSRCTVVVPVARLVIEQSNPGPTTTPGSVVPLGVTFTNTGQVPYTGISISSPGADVLDDASSAGNQTASSGTLSVTPSAIMWTGSIPVGGTVTVSGTLVVNAAAALGNRVLSVPWISDAPGNNCPSGSSDPRCSVTITVLVPGLTITKAADVSEVVAGGVVAYTVTIANTGETPYAGVTVTDTLTGVLDDAAYNADLVASAGTVSFSSPTLTWTGDLAVGASVTVSYSVTTAEVSTGNQELLNVVTSDAVGSSCPTGTTADGCRSGVDVLTPRLTIAKTADLAAVTLGRTVTYTVTVTNSGQTSYPAAAFTDDLTGVLDDASYDTGSAIATRGTVAVTPGAVNWSGALSPGQVAVVSYSVTVANPASGDGTMTNVVVSDTARSNCAAANTDTRCTSVLAVTNATSLTLTKRADVTSAAAGDVVRFSVEVLNSTDATLTDVDLTDPLADVLDDATFNDDLAASSGTVTRIGDDLSWSGSVGAGATVTITYSVTVDAGGAGNELLRGVVSSAAEPGSNNCAPGSTDARCAATVGVASLDLWQYADVATATPGSVIQLTAVYTNTGQVPYNDISVVSPRADTSDDTIPTGEQSASSGTFLRTVTAVIWTGDIPVGGSVTVIRTLRVRDPDPGNQVITATVSSDAAGNSCPSGTTNPRCTFVVDVLTPRLTITKTADRAATPTGGTAGFTIVIANAGQTPYAGATVTDDLAGVLDDAGYAGDAVVDVGTLSYAAPTLTWTGDLAVGQTATITYSVTAANPGTGDKVMVNPVSSTAVGSTCPAGSTTVACRATVVVLTPALTISTETDLASAVPGDVVTSVVTVQNTGQTPYSAAEVTVPLGGLLDDATYNADAAANAGDVSVTGGVLTWTGSLGVGEDATIAYSVTVDDPVSGGDYRLDQTATSGNSGSNCPVGSLDERCAASVPVASLQLTTVADRATTKPTDVVTYIGTFVNLGQVDYEGISVSTSFVGALDDATYSGDATATSGSLVAVTGSGRITWTGDIPVGGTVTVTGTLTVRNPDPGDQVMTTRTSSSAPATNCVPTSADPRCVTSTPVLTPSLTIVKTVDAATSTPGSVLGYTVTVSNDGQTGYDDASFTDSLADVLTEADYLGDAAASVGSVDYAAPELVWTGDLAAGESAVITYSVRIDDPDLGDKMIGNAVVSDELGSSCPTGGNAAGCRTMVAVLVPALSIDVAADQTATTPGSTVDYTVTVRNTGETAYAGATVTISLAGVLDDATFGGTADASSGTVDYSAPVLTWTGDLAIGTSATITYRVTVKNGDFGDRLLQTSVSSAEAGSSCPADSACSHVVAVRLPGLAITTTADRATVTPGNRVTFSFTVTNTGEVIYPVTSVSTSLADVLDDGALAGSFRVSRGTVDYEDATLTWTGTLLLGQSAVVSYDVDVDDPDTGNRSLVSTMFSGAAGSTCPADTFDPLCTADVTVLVPSLAISKTAGAPTTTPGGIVTYTIVVRNEGETDYVGAQVTDSLSGLLLDAVYNGDAQVTGGGTVDYQDPVLTWTGDLPIGASAAISYSVTVNDPDTGDKRLVNAVTSATPGSTCPRADSQPSCAVEVTVLVPELQLTKSVDKTTVTAGDAVRYTVTVTNTGETDYAPATFTDALTEVLDDGPYAGDAVASVGTVDVADDTLVWSGSLEVGASASVTYAVTTEYPATGDGVLTNAVTSDSSGASCRAGTEDGCRTEVGVVVPELTVTKTADVSEIVAGGRVGYTLTATNTGAADYPVATLTDTLAGVLDDAVYREDGVATVGVLDDADGTIRWSGPLAVGASVVITFSVDVDLAGAGDAELRNTVESATRGSTCPTGNAASACTSTVAVIARSITISDLAPSFTLTGPPGSVVSRDEAVNLTVATNSAGGYVVTVQGRSDTMTPTAPGNSDTIPLDRLSVRPSGSTAPYEPLSQQPLTVHRAYGPSAPNGDAIGNDYQVEIPFVNTDTYTTTLEYIATVQ